MVEQLSAHKVLSQETIATLVERTGGVPPFVEELTRAVTEADGEKANRKSPTTLHDSLMARLDHLDTAKEVARLCRKDLG